MALIKQIAIYNAKISSFIFLPRAFHVFFLAPRKISEVEREENTNWKHGENRPREFTYSRSMSMQSNSRLDKLIVVRIVNDAIRNYFWEIGVVIISERKWHDTTLLPILSVL